jgi:hypothetical protein
VLTTDRFNKRVLGIAVGERSMRIAELTVARSGIEATHAAEFIYPTVATLEQGSLLGSALAEFLQQKGFTARRVVLGVPAKWLIFRTHTLPPVDSQTAVAMLSLHAESSVAPELGEMVFDFSGEASSGETGSPESNAITLLGLPRRWKERLQAVAASAGLKVAAIVPCACALRGGAKGTVANSLSLSVHSEGAELALHQSGRLTFLRHLGTATAIPQLVAELRRSAAVLPIGTEPAMTLWDDIGLSDVDSQAIQSAIGVKVVHGDLRIGGPALSQGHVSPSAVALAMAGQGRAEIDFLHPRLSQSSRQMPARRTVWIAGVSAVVALLALLVYLDLSSIQRQITQTDDRLQTLDPTLQIAGPFVANMQLVEGFQAGKPKSLTCLRDLTLILPEDGMTFLTAFHLQADTKGEFAGRAGSNQDVDKLMEKLTASARFVDLKCRVEGRGSGSDVLFTVTFTYVQRQ